MNYEKIERDSIELVKKYGVKAASDFWTGVYDEGFVYYITSFGNPYKEDSIYKEYLTKPFLEALEFFETLAVECRLFIDK